MHALNPQQMETYLRYLDVPAPQRADLATLDRLIAAHQQRVAFENVDVLLDRPIAIEANAVFAKVVERQRGGYCFELNSLFARLLLGLGYPVELLIARVRWGLPLDAPQTMQSHLALRVQLDEGPFLVDVGFGSATPFRAMPLDGTELPDFPFRLRSQDDASGELQLENHRPEQGWVAVYRFNLTPSPWVDYIARNWYTSTHPDSIFRQMLMIARTEGDSRLTLANGTFNRRYIDGRVDSRTLESAEQIIETLLVDFRIGLVEEDIEPLRVRLEGLLKA
ncbi:arylamine N-acetyltransferase [Pseudomonas boanensis]|uniref:arylamine N-acetyltransferase family protein n=1 Tax=Metapseudomonas boanensis TaxID=2822138 RepID=UPI0035D4DC65